MIHAVNPERNSSAVWPSLDFFEASLVTLEVHLVQEIGSFLVSRNRPSALKNSCVPSGHVSAWFPFLVLSVPLLAKDDDDDLRESFLPQNAV